MIYLLIVFLMLSGGVIEYTLQGAWIFVLASVLIAIVVHVAVRSLR